MGQAPGPSLTVESRRGQSTLIRATFHADHIEMKPLGDAGRTMAVLKATHPEVCFDFDLEEEP